MPKGIPNAPRKPRAAANGGDDKYRKLEARVVAAENKIEALLKSTKAGLIAAANSLPAQRPGRTPSATKQN